MTTSGKGIEVRILRLPEVRRIVGLGRSMIYQLESEGKFPSRVRIGLRAVGWVDREIFEWIAKRLEARRNEHRAA